VKSFSETHPESGLASGPVDVHWYDDGRLHEAETIGADASNTMLAVIWLTLDFTSLIVKIVFDKV
jgi:hypothetical protein